VPAFPSYWAALACTGRTLVEEPMDRAGIPFFRAGFILHHPPLKCKLSMALGQRPIAASNLFSFRNQEKHTTDHRGHACHHKEKASLDFLSFDIFPVVRLPSIFVPQYHTASGAFLRALGHQGLAFSASARHIPSRVPIYPPSVLEFFYPILGQYDVIRTLSFDFI